MIQLDVVLGKTLQRVTEADPSVQLNVQVRALAEVLVGEVNRALKELQKRPGTTRDADSGEPRQGRPEVEDPVLKAERLEFWATCGIKPSEEDTAWLKTFREAQERDKGPERPKIPKVVEFRREDGE